MARITLVLIAALALALGACTMDTADPATAGDGDGTATDGAGGALSCEEAFEQIDTTDAMEAIEESTEALDETIAACDSIEEWAAFADSALGITQENSLAFVEGRCRANPELVHTGPCANVSSPEPTST